MYLTQSEIETETIYFTALHHSMNDCWTIFNDFKGLTDVYWGVKSHSPVQEPFSMTDNMQTYFSKQQHHDRIQKID